ncbi:MAG: efflux RND transporter periplasmic adaptor subunit [Gudongella sp.]|nr:efflux RND transporter periplasmic adaptor subunit [Gudongella sp.]
MKKRNFIILAIVLVGGAFLVNKFLIDKDKDQNISIVEKKGFVTELYKIERETMIDSLKYNGTLSSANSATISSLTQGDIMEVLVEEGDTVKKGDTLIKVDVDKLVANKSSVIKSREKVSSQLQYANKKIADYYTDNSLLLKLEALEENIRYNEEELGKLNQLLEAGAVAQTTVDGARHGLELLKIQRDELSTTINEGYDKISSEASILSKQIEEINGSLSSIDLTISDGNIRAPFDGKVTSILVSKGELLTPGKPVLNIEEVSNVIASADIGEVDLIKLKQGMKSYVSIASGEKKYNGVVKYLSSSINPKTRLGEIEVSVDIPVDEVVLGASAQITVLLSEKEDQILIPITAVKSFGDNDYVYKQAEDEKVYERAVELGERIGDSYQVIEGLEEGDIIAIRNISSLGNGVSIYTITKEGE